MFCIFHAKSHIIWVYIHSNIEDIPSFVSHNDRRLNLLGEMIELKRLELERISQRHDSTLLCIINLYESARSNIIFLRKQHRYLSSFAEQLSREGQIRNKLSDCTLNTLHNVEEQRGWNWKINGINLDVLCLFNVFNLMCFVFNQLEIAKVSSNFEWFFSKIFSKPETWASQQNLTRLKKSYQIRVVRVTVYAIRNNFIDLKFWQFWIMG